MCYRFCVDLGALISTMVLGFSPILHLRLLCVDLCDSGSSDCAMVARSGGHRIDTRCTERSLVYLVSGLSM